MIGMQMSAAAKTLDASRTGEDVRFSGCDTDSRALSPGALFAALKGERFDGHDFIDQARARGAAAALVEKPLEGGFPSLVVADTRRALGKLARAWRRRFQLPVVAVTGSNGKTTVKEMLASILSGEGAVLATLGNYNNDIGLPLTLFRLGAEHRFAVLEMGANHAGEIAALADMAGPDVGIVTQCAPAHLEGFGSVDAVARAKGELFEGLAADGTAVINADDAYAGLWRELAGSRRQLTFGMGSGADVSARCELGSERTRLELQTPAGSTAVNLALAGRHNVMNALAASAAALAVGVPLGSIREGLEDMRPVAGRLQFKAGHGGARIIDDTYNANPASLAAGISVLGNFDGHRWLVLGDMAELGSGAEAYHRDVGRLAKEKGVERIYAIGTLSRSAIEAFGAHGRHYDSPGALVQALRADLAAAAGVTLLVKGSRSSRMEQVVMALVVEG